MSDKLWYNLLNRVEDEELGLAVETNNPKMMQIQLCNAAKGMEKYEHIVICIPSIENFVFLTKKSVDLNDAAIS